MWKQQKVKNIKEGNCFGVENLKEKDFSEDTEKKNKKNREEKGIIIYNEKTENVKKIVAVGFEPTRNFISAEDLKSSPSTTRANQPVTIHVLHLGY